jgi:hypothetical protein
MPQEGRSPASSQTQMDVLDVRHFKFQSFLWRNLDRESKFSTVGLENSCGKEGAVNSFVLGPAVINTHTGRRGRGTRPHEPRRRLSFRTSRRAHNLNEYKVKKV